MVLLGDELMRLRERSGLTRRQACRQLEGEDNIAPQTLATYERGLRRITTPRLAALCAALGGEAPHLIRRVMSRMRSHEGEGMQVHLHSLAADESSALAPLRRWAEHQLNQAHRPGDLVELGWPALQESASLCDMDLATLITTLRDRGHAETVTLR